MEWLTRVYLLRSPTTMQVDEASEEQTLVAMGGILQRLAARKPSAVLGSPDHRLQRKLAERIGQPLRVVANFGLRDEWDSASQSQRVLRELDSLAAEFGRGEVVVLLHLDAIRAALGKALQSESAATICPEPGQAIALDWPHPDAREVRPALIGIGFDWDLPPASEKVHKFPGGASVLPRGS